MKSKLSIGNIFTLLLSVVAVVGYCITHNAHVAGVLAIIPIINNMDARIAYSNAVKYLTVDKGIKLEGNKKLTQSYLQSETLLNQNISNYQMGINAATNIAGVAPYPEEQRLQLQDAFFVSSVGYMIRVLSTSGQNTNKKNELMTFPSAWFFGSAGVNNDLMTVLWNGYMKLQVNNNIITPAWDLQRHYSVPETQYPAWNGALPNGVLYPLFDEIDGAQTGFYPTEPMWVLDGGYGNDLYINYNEPISGAGLGNMQVRIVVILRGVLAQNCGKIMG